MLNGSTCNVYMVLVMISTAGLEIEEAALLILWNFRTGADVCDVWDSELEQKPIISFTVNNKRQLDSRLVRSAKKWIGTAVKQSLRPLLYALALLRKLGSFSGPGVVKKCNQICLDYHNLWWMARNSRNLITYYWHYGDWLSCGVHSELK